MDSRPHGPEGYVNSATCRSVPAMTDGWQRAALGQPGDGSLRLHLGMAFDRRIAVDEDDKAAGLETDLMASVLPLTDTASWPVLLRSWSFEDPPHAEAAEPRRRTAASA